MNNELTFIERFMDLACQWLEQRLPRRHALAAVGDYLASTHDQVLLPTDRRTHQSFMSGMGGGGEAGATARQNRESMEFYAHKMDRAADQRSCNFWAYCNMTGYPCTVCGGSNGLRSSAPDPHAAGTHCPPGSRVGQYWSGCCQKPDGSIHYVAWLDCGRSSTRPCSPTWCENFPGVKDWTLGAGRYYCTVAVTIPSKNAICR